MTHEIQDPTLRKAVAALPRETQPEHDLWPGIAARIAPRRRRLPWPLAAGVAGLIAISVIAATLSIHHRPSATTFAIRQPTTQPQPLAIVPLPTERARAIAATIRRTTGTDPKTQAVLLKNLAIVETSIASVQRALREDPGNIGLEPLLYQLYRQEAAIVTAAQRVQLQNTTGVITL